MEKELELSENFDIKDIRKIRDYNAERYATMSPTEIVAETRSGAEKVLRLLKCEYITAE